MWQFQGETARSEALYLVGGCLPPLSKYVLIKLDHFPKFRGINSKEILETTKLLFFFLNRQTSKLWNLDNSSPTSPSTPIVKLKQAVATCISLGRVHLSRKYSNFCWPYRSNYKHQEFTLSSPAICPRVNLNKIGDRISTCFLGDDNDPKKINLKHHLSVHHDSIPIYFKFPTPFVYLWQQ